MPSPGGSPPGPPLLQPPRPPSTSLLQSPPPPLPDSLRFRRPAVRDLAWLVLDGALELPPATQALATVRLTPPERTEFLGLMRQWDEGSDDAWLGPVDPRLRLGLYSERLIGAWLRHSRQIRLLAMNWPLRANRITLGEADFLVERKAGGAAERQLWELACKFYLGVPGRGWLGPGLNDSLAAKLSRVRGHQLQLVHQDGFQAAWGDGWSACAWMAGWLLSPASLLDAASPGEHLPSRSRIPAVWAEDCSASLAVAERHARELGVTQWWLLPKRRWLRPVYDDAPVAEVFTGLAEAAACLAAAADGGGRAMTAEAESAPTSPRFAQEDGPRPLMLAGIRWLSGPGAFPVEKGSEKESERGSAGTDTVGSAVAAEAIRLMLVPQGWSLRAHDMAMHPESAVEGGTAGQGGGDYLKA